MKLLPETEAGIIPSIAIDALLAQRDTAVAHLRAVAIEVKGYQEVGETIWRRKSDEQHQQIGDAAPFCYREPVEPRTHTASSKARAP